MDQRNHLAVQEGCIPAGNNFDEIKDRSSDAEGFDCYCGQGLSAGWCSGYNFNEIKTGDYINYSKYVRCSIRSGVS